jgi:hypothetical protein
MRIFETLHYQFSTGVLEPKLFEAELNTLKWSVAMRCSASRSLMWRAGRGRWDRERRVLV